MKNTALLTNLGNSCRDWRKRNDVSIHKIIRETRYTLDEIRQFENGNSNNVALFLWYLAHGFDTEKDFIAVTEDTTKLYTNAKDFYTKSRAIDRLLAAIFKDD